MSAPAAEKFYLYSTSACHLCDQALEMLDWARSSGLEITVETIDISESDALFERYGLRIPVLRRADGEELDWPFEPDRLIALLSP